MKNGSKNMTGQSNRYLQDGYAYVSNSWIPADPKVITEVQQAFNDNRYKEDRELLLSDLKKDAGLFTHCLKHLLQNSQKEELSEATNPIALIRSASLELIREAVSKGSSPTHSFSNAESAQSSVIQESIISTTTAELLADNLNVDSDLAFSCALFRQMGSLLIAWNYPHIYERALEMAESGESLDLHLSKMLGFSRSTLAYTIAKKWNLTPEIRLGMGDNSLDLSEDINAQEIYQTSEMLQKVCRLGEALSRVAHPESYPEALHDWGSAKEDFLEILAPEALKQLKDKLKTACGSFLESTSTMLSSIDAIVEAPTRTRKKTSLKLANNLYIKYCTPSLKRMFEALYERIRIGSNAHDSLEFLLKDIIPSAGFRRGCIYLLDPESGNLTPRSSIGTSAGEGLKEVIVRGFNADDSLVALAYKTNNMVMDEDGELIKCAAVLGDTQRAGVLYLETTETMLPQGFASLKPHFRAIKQALCDCMDLS